MKRYFSSIKQYSWILLVCTIIAAGAGYTLAKAQPVSYQVSSIMFVSVGAPGTTFSSTGASSATAADSLTTAANYSAEILTRSVMNYIFQANPQIAKRGYTANDLLGDIQPVASTTSPTISITALAPNASDAVLLANAVADGFQSYNQKQLQDHLDLLRGNIQNELATYQKQNTDLENKIQTLNNPQDARTALWTTDRSDIIHNIDALQSQLQSLPTSIRSDVYVVQDAQTSDAQPSTKTSTIVAATAGVGLLLGLVIMLLLIFLDSRLRSEEQVTEKLGLAYLGSLSTSKELESSPTRISGSTAQQMADICANLRLTGVLSGQWQAPHGGVLLVTSPQTSEGKTTLAVALAATCVRSGGSAVVIDGNLHQPSTHLAFGMSPVGIGLSGLLKGNGQSVDDAVVRSNIPGVWLLPAGAPTDESAFLIAQKMPAIIAQARKKIDFIIIDGPALLSGADASLLASLADGVALVVDVRHEKLPQLLRTRELLRSLAHAPAGVVMNRFKRSGRKGNRYYAAAFPVEAASAGWVPVKVHESSSNGNGKGAGNGQRSEQVATTTLLATPPSPVPQSAAKMPTPLPMSTLPSVQGRPGLPAWSGPPPLYTGKDE